MRRSLALGTVILALALTGCGGSNAPDPEPPKPDKTAVPASPMAPEATTPPPGGGTGQLPPEFLKCMADQGYELDSADIHSAPPEVLQACFAALHGG